MRTWAAYAGAVLVLVLATEARGGDPEDLIFANGFEAAPCDPDYGAHSTEATALNLGTINDCAASALDVDGVLGTSQETDYSRFDGVDTFGCAVRPTLMLVATDSLRACMFYDCEDGTTGVSTCLDGSSPATSPSGLPGCCRSGSAFALAADINCGSFDDSARVFIRLDNAATGCTDYSVNVQY